MVYDDLGRLHVVFVAVTPQSGKVQPGIVVLFGLEQTNLSQLTLCQTVDVFSDPYPFCGPEGNPNPITRALATTVCGPEGNPSPITRALAATDGDLWLFGSDGGIGRVADTLQDGSCEGGMVMYEPIYRRDTHSTLPTNIVPALVVGTDGTLWLGTALGLAQLQNDVFIPHLFPQDDNPDSEVAGNPVTLEMGFLKIAQAISNAKPILSVSIGGVSFVATFGRPLINADLIFSAIEETPHRLWVGTLGGGLRRVDVTSAGPEDTPEDTLLLTRKDGLGSNIILALAVERKGIVWVATDEGVSRLETEAEPIRITNFSALDGLQTPVKDLAIDKYGTIWLATGGGLYRIVQHDGFMQGDAQTTQ
jgi:hypothetical protein